MKRYAFAAVFIMVIIVVFIAWTVSSDETSAPLSENEMRVEYSCDRITTDILKTDVYCSDYNKYIQDFNNGSLIVD